VADHRGGDAAVLAKGSELLVQGLVTGGLGGLVLVHADTSTQYATDIWRASRRSSWAKDSHSRVMWLPKPDRRGSLAPQTDRRLESTPTIPKGTAEARLIKVQMSLAKWTLMTGLYRSANATKAQASRGARCWVIRR
jgi:hypothetical protein